MRVCQYKSVCKESAFKTVPLRIMVSKKKLAIVCGLQMSRGKRGFTRNVLYVSKRVS